MEYIPLNIGILRAPSNWLAIALIMAFLFQSARLIHQSANPPN